MQRLLFKISISFFFFHRWLKNDTSSVAIPTHYYKIILRCDTNKNPYYRVPGCEGRLDVISFILPHLPRRPCSQVSPPIQLKKVELEVKSFKIITLKIWHFIVVISLICRFSFYSLGSWVWSVTGLKIRNTKNPLVNIVSLWVIDVFLSKWFFWVGKNTIQGKRSDVGYLVFADDLFWRLRA